MEGGDKSLQNRVIALAKGNDLAGMREIIDSCACGTLLLSDYSRGIPMAISMAANIVSSSIAEFTGGPNSGAIYSSVRSVTQTYPVLLENENIRFALVKLALASNEIDQALHEALECSSPRLRLFSPILQVCGDRGFTAKALHVLECITSRDLTPCESDYGHVLRSLLTTSECVDAPTIAFKLLNELSSHFDVITSVLLRESLVSVFSKLGLKVHEDISIKSSELDATTSASTGACPSTGVTLRRLKLSEAELDEMIELTRKLSLEATRLRYGEEGKDEFTPIIESLTSLPTVILDAANIAHTNQNFAGGYFRFDQIEAIMDLFRQKGERCLVVIHEKWLDESRSLLLRNPDQESSKKKRKKICLPQLGESTVEGRPVDFHLPAEHPAPKSVGVSESVPDRAVEKAVEQKVPVELISRWRENRELLVVPHGQNDDWFWMHVCLLSAKAGSEVVLVSNDQMRDHFWRMKTPAFFKRFCQNYLCGYSIKFGEDLVNHYSVSMPEPFTTAIQCNNGSNGVNVWHIPYEASKPVSPDQSAEIRWIAIEES